jgi:hypothetical protein
VALGGLAVFEETNVLFLEDLTGSRMGVFYGLDLHSKTM